MGLVTCNGKSYNPTNVENETLKGRAIVDEPNREKTNRLKSPINELVTAKEAREFLKFLKHSEYSVVE